MKLPCRVIEDLLPLYTDGVCSQESSALVREHLQDCPACSALQEKMENSAQEPHPSFDDTRPLKAIGTAWKKGRRMSFVKGAVLTLVFCALLAGSYFGLTQWRCVPVSADLLEVTEVSQLSDGRIVYHLYVKDDKTLHFIKFALGEDGAYYMTPMRAVIERPRTMEKGLYNDYFVVDLAQPQADSQDTAVTSCYVGPQGEGILIWEEGMELPAASEALEQLVLEEE